MSDQFKFDVENIGDVYQNSVAYSANPDLNVIFDKNRRIIHCNPAVLNYLDASTPEEANTNFYNMVAVNRQFDRNALETFMRGFEKAEAGERSEFDFALPWEENIFYAHVVIKRIVFGGEDAFVVAGYDMTNMRSAEIRLAKQDTYLNALNLIGEILLSADHVDFDSALDKVIEVVGQTFSAEWASICRLTVEENTTKCLSLNDWQREGGFDNEMPASSCTCLPDGWTEMLTGGGLIRRSLSEVNGDEAAALVANGFQYVTLVPIAINNELWGCLRLLYKEARYLYTESSNNAISGVANLLASGIMRNDSNGLLMESVSTNRAIFDSNPFFCIMFDEDANMIDCNKSARGFLKLHNLNDPSKKFIDQINAIVPEYQIGERRSLPFIYRIKTAFDEGYCEFETSLKIAGKILYFNIIMRRVMYNNKATAVAYMFDLTAQKEVQFKLEYHDNLLEELGSVANLLLSTDANDLNVTMNRVLEMIGKAAMADRVYVWKNRIGADERIYTEPIFEWFSDDSMKLKGGFPENLLLDEVAMTWTENLQKGIARRTITRNAAPEEQGKLRAHGVASMLVVPVFLSGMFWGFIGFDDCHNERVFSSIEENVLRICGFMTMVISDTIQNEIAMHLLAEREAALISAQMKSNFLANMSHEIRTPMNAILGMTELIMHENISGVVLGHASDIRNACRGLLTIINDILDISKIESGKLEIVPARYHISSLLMDVISIIKTRAENKAISFVVNIDNTIPSELIGDEQRIKQILINILNNAVKFTHEGQITLDVTSQLEGNNCRITFAVSDTGIGIRNEDMEKVFVLFQQIDTKRNRDIEGTGLGLSISKQLAEMMDGSIEMQSEYGAGSTFTVSIKQKIANRQPVAALKYPERNSVLVYENRSEYLDSIVYTLETLDCNYKVCANRADMYERLDDFVCDYIFVSSLYIESVQSTAARKQPDAVVVVFNGESIPNFGSNMISVSMPIHCLQIASIMNDEYYVKASDTPTAKIIAPEAKVLVVDDNAVNLKVAVGLLNVYQIRADSVSSGIRAVELVRESDYDLVFMDHMMPEMDGIDTTVAIRGLGGKYSGLPIIALTANAVGGVREMFIAEGMNDFLAKPIEITKLDAILRKWLPVEKQMDRVEETISEEAFIEINGVNTRKGLRHSGGIPEDYHEILAIYAADSEKRLVEMAKYNKENDMKALTICMHAIKSASANVGAEGISATAAELEIAGKAGERHYINVNIQPFFDSLASLLEDIRIYLADVQKDQIKNSRPADLNFLKLSLTEMSLHMDNLNVDAVEGTLKELNEYRWEDNIFELIDQMKSCIDIFDYDGFAAAAAKLTEMSGSL